MGLPAFQIRRERLLRGTFPGDRSLSIFPRGDLGLSILRPAVNEKTEYLYNASDIVSGAATGIFPVQKCLQRRL